MHFDRRGNEKTTLNKIFQTKPTVAYSYLWGALGHGPLQFWKFCAFCSCCQLNCKNFENYHRKHVLPFRRGGDLGGLGGRSPQNLRWGTAHALVHQYFEKQCCRMCVKV